MSYSTEVLADSPRGYWKLDETVGNFADSSGNNHTATTNGVITYSAAGQVNTAILLDGATGYLSVADHADFDLGDVLTLEAWVKQTQNGNYMTIVEKDTNAYRFRLDPTGYLNFTKANVGVICGSTIRVPNDGNMHHVVVTKSGVDVHLYIDAVDVTGTLTNRTLSDNSSALGIGARTGGSQDFLEGMLDEVAIYATALSSARIQAHFDAAQSVETPPEAPDTSFDLSPFAFRTLGPLFCSETLACSEDLACADQDGLVVFTPS